MYYILKLKIFVQIKARAGFHKYKMIRSVPLTFIQPLDFLSELEMLNVKTQPLFFRSLFFDATSFFPFISFFVDA